MLTDFELLQRIAAADQSALRELYDRYFNRLSRFLLRMTGDTETVAELINDVFLVVWQSAGRFRGDSTVSTWILGVAYRKALKALKAKRTTVPLDEEDLHMTETESAAEDIAAVIDKLSPIHKSVMELTYYFGYTYKEIAEICGSPENTIKTRMFHARRHLKSIIEV